MRREVKREKEKGKVGKPPFLRCRSSDFNCVRSTHSGDVTSLSLCPRYVRDSGLLEWDEGSYEKITYKIK
jgi:hypothetical protein